MAGTRREGLQKPQRLILDSGAVIALAQAALRDGRAPGGGVRVGSRQAVSSLKVMRQRAEAPGLRVGLPAQQEALHREQNVESI